MKEAIFRLKNNKFIRRQKLKEIQNKQFGTFLNKWMHLWAQQKEMEGWGSDICTAWENTLKQTVIFDFGLYKLIWFESMEKEWNNPKQYTMS